MSHHKNFSEVIFSIVIVSICTAILLFWLAGVQKMSLSNLILNVINNFYPLASRDIFARVMKINNINVNIYIYLLIMVSILTSFFFKVPIAKTKNKIGLIFCPYRVFLLTLIVFFLISGIQTFNQIKRFSSKIKLLSGKTLSEKYSLIFGDPLYRFAMFCQEHFPGEHRAKLVTDLDLNEDPGMTLYYRLCYYLYPINVRISTDQPVDCYIVFHKKDPLTAIPKDIKALYTFNQFGVLAIKEEGD